MADMENTQVIHMAPARDRRVARAVQARRALDAHAEPPAERRGGRAWVNGLELGGTREALAHLAESYD